MGHIQRLFILSVTCLLGFTCVEARSLERADDPVPLETLVMQQADTISQLQAELASMKTQLANTDSELERLKSLFETKVAFNVGLIGHQHNFSGSSIIIFDRVDLNQGNGYDRRTGVFTAPVTGLYVFSLKIAHTPPGAFHAIVMKEGAEITEVHASGEGTHPDRSSATVAVQLNAGQRVWVRREGTQSSTSSVEGDWRSSFTGFLVRADQTA